MMAPSLEEPIRVNLSAPLMVAPKLVAPEPGMIHTNNHKRPRTPSHNIMLQY